MHGIKKIKRLANRFNGWFFRWLYFSTQFTLIPLAGINVKQQGWLWRRADPKIQLSSKGRVKLHGFYMLEIEYESFSHSGNSTLHVDYGEGFSRGNTYLLPIKSANNKVGVAKRICYFSGYVDDLFWQPSDTSGACEGISIKLVKLNARKCRKLMFKKLANNSLSEGRNDDELLLSDAALYAQYNDMFIKLEPSFNYLNWMNERRVSPSYEHSIQPLMSVVVTPYNANPQWLAECFKSVMEQNYTNWQLIIVAIESDVTESMAVIQEYKAVADDRIKVLFTAINEHTYASKNLALSEVEGEYVLFLNQHDALDGYALDELVKSIQLNPDAQLIYSDEDLMAEDGKRYAPYLKPGWNPEVLLNHNYLGQSCCYPIELLDSLGGFRGEFPGAEDYDFVLRASSVLNSNNVVHVPKVLYHTRIFDNTSHTGAGQAFDVSESKLAVVQAYIARENLNAKTRHKNESNVFHVDWLLSAAPKKITIVMVVSDELHLFKPSLLNVLKVTAYNNFEVIVIDNDSQQAETLNFLTVMGYDPRIQVIRSESKLSYAGAHNLAVSSSKGDFVCLLGCNVEIFNSSWLLEMLSIAARENIGCVGGKLVSPDLKLSHAGENLGLSGYVSHFHKAFSKDAVGGFCWANIRQQVCAVSGACLLVKRSILIEAGGFDEAYEAAYTDVDLCLRVNDLGYRNIYTPYTEVIYNKFERYAGEDESKDISLFNARWKKSLQSSAFYNPNFTRSDEDFFRYD